MSEYFWIEKLRDKPKYKLGQNFLIDTNISRKITKFICNDCVNNIKDL